MCRRRTVRRADYGSIGVVFIIPSWLIGVGVVVMGGAVMGAWY